MLDALGNVGDFIGGIGVVITLAYLAVQIRHNSRVAALAAGHSISIGFTEFLERITLDPELYSIWNRAFNSPDSLDEVERDRFDRLMVGVFLRCLDGHRHGELDAETAERFDRIARHYLRLTAVQAWWRRASEFVQSINPDLAGYIGGQLKIAESGDSPAA